MRRRPLLGYLLAVVAFALALALRLALDHSLPPGFPFLTFFPAVIITTFVAGWAPGLFCAVLSGVAAWAVFISPRDVLTIQYPAGVAITFYVAIVVIDIVLIHAMQVATRKLNAERAVTAALYERQRTMFQELQHRVANNMAFIGGFLSYQRREIANDPANATQAIDEAVMRLDVMARLHRRLYDPNSAEAPIKSQIEELTRDVVAAVGARSISIDVEAPPLELDLSRRVTVSLIIAEAVTNALKHAFSPGQAGTISIKLVRAPEKKVLLTIRDNGRGFPADIDTVKTGSLGIRIMQALAEQIGGDVTVCGASGTTTSVTFPLKNPAII